MKDRKFKIGDLVRVKRFVDDGERIGLIVKFRGTLKESQSSKVNEIYEVFIDKQLIFCNEKILTLLSDESELLHGEDFHGRIDETLWHQKT